MGNLLFWISCTVFPYSGRSKQANLRPLDNSGTKLVGHQYAGASHVPDSVSTERPVFTGETKDFMIMSVVL